MSPDAFQCDYGRMQGMSKQAAYLHRLVRAGRCVDCRQVHDRGTWVCMACRVKRQAIRVSKAKP